MVSMKIYIMLASVYIKRGTVFSLYSRSSIIKNWWDPEVFLRCKIFKWKVNPQEDLIGKVHRKIVTSVKIILC